MMPTCSGDSPRSTGRQIDEMTLALINAAHDKDTSVQRIISRSLYELGCKEPVVVLSALQNYLATYAKIAQGHRVLILATMERIIKESLPSITRPLALRIIKQASEELTKSKEVIPDWQTAASGALVAIGGRYCNDVMESLMLKFQPGNLPHFFVVQTLANLATTNVFGMVPFLSVIMGTMLPMLTLAKHDNMRWIFASAFAKFCFAILDYIANVERAPDPSVRRQFFTNEVNSAYEIFFNVWLQSKEAKLRTVIIEAIGYMTNIMRQTKLEDHVTRLVPAILGLYKKHHDTHLITQALCMVLEAATANENKMLEPQLENLLTQLFVQVCQLPDYTNPQTMKNHNELLRCFAVLVRSFSDHVVTFLLVKLENTNERARMGGLAIIRHVVNTADAHMDNKKDLVVSGLKIMLLETNNKVKKIFSQVIIALAGHGYLQLEGGHLMVQFIIRHCALGDSATPSARRPTDPEYMSNDSLRAMCDNILQLLSSTIDCMDPVLWPYVLEFLVLEPYTEAMAALCKCVVNLATSDRPNDQNGDEINRNSTIDYAQHVNCPRPCALLARLLVMIGRPLKGRKRGIPALNALRSLAPTLHEDIVELVDTVVPKLVQYFEDNCHDDDDDDDDDDDGSKWSQKCWEDLLLKMLSKILDEVDDEDWQVLLGEAMLHQLTLYNKHAQDKNFLYKCLGIVLKKTSRKDFVPSSLDVMFSSVNHCNQEEREGCAVALGFCATSHLDVVLSKLELASRAQTSRKPSGFLGFIKERKESVVGGGPDGDPEKVKATLMLCYGYVALYGPPAIIVSRIEASILRTIDPQFANTKEDCVKQNLVRSVELIASALHPKHLQATHSFSKKTDLLNHVTAYVRAEPAAMLHSETRMLAMNACAALVQLEPTLSLEEEDELIKTSLDRVLSLPIDGVSVKKAKDESYPDVRDAGSLMEGTMSSLRNLLKQILLTNVSPDHLENIFKHLMPWLLAVHDHERSRALLCFHTLVLAYYESMKIGMGAPSSLSNAGLFLARLTPRCTDPVMLVRQTAMDCVYIIMKIMHRYEGHDVTHHDPLIEALDRLKDRQVTGEASALYGLVTDLGKVFSKKIPVDQLVLFTDTLYDGLLDVQSHSSSGACVVLNTMFKTRAGELYRHVDRILSTLHPMLSQLQFSTTRTGALRAIRLLSSQHLLLALNALLEFPLPFDDDLIDIWQSLASDSELRSNMLIYVLEMIQRARPYDGRGMDGGTERGTERGMERGMERKNNNNKTNKIALAQPLAATSALCQIFKVQETAPEVVQHFNKIFSTLLVLIGAMNGAEAPKAKHTNALDKKDEKSLFRKKKETAMKEIQICPSSIVVETFHQFLSRAGSTAVLDILDQADCWRMFEDADEYTDAVSILAKAIAQHEASHLAYIVASINPVLSGVYDGQRIVVAAFFAELVNERCGGDMVLLDVIMNSLLARLVDSNCRVRMYCIRGLGNVASVGHLQVQQFSTTVLSAMMAGMEDVEDVDDVITLEAMSGLSRVLAQIDEVNIRAILVNISLRIRPCFEKARAEVRAAAFTLFGHLSSFADGPSRAPILEQIHTNIISVLVHLNDPDPRVVKACKAALRQLGPLIGSDDMNHMLQTILLDGAQLHYGEFINDLTKVIIKDFPDKLNFYTMACLVFLRSSWSEIQCNATMLVGFLLGNLPSDRQTDISKEHVCSALISLLKDPSTAVRAKAAEAISLLHQY